MILHALGFANGIFNASPRFRVKKTTFQYDLPVYMYNKENQLKCEPVARFPVAGSMLQHYPNHGINNNFFERINNISSKHRNARTDLGRHS